MKLLARLSILILSCSTLAYSWGPRGHETITIVATKLLEAQCGKQCAHPFLARDQMLGYLANVPDSYWRGVKHPQLEFLNASHFIGLEWFRIPKNQKDRIDFKVTEAEQLHENACRTKQLGRDECNEANLTQEQLFRKAGVATFRIAQLASMLEGHLKSKALTIADIDNSLLIAGILSHYVADLSNPLHTTVDYDAWSGQAGGLHVYFESEVVDAYDLTLAQQILKTAQNNNLKTEKATYLSTAFALAKDSHLDLNLLKTLDRTHLLKTPSKITKEGLRIKAGRIPAAQALSTLSPLILKRMAIAAVYIAYIWQKTWVSAGKPDLTAYQSYTYFHAPAPIVFEFPSSGR